MSEYIINVTQEFVDLYGWQLREEIVRCNSCKYYDECWTSEVYPNRHWCDRLTVYMTPNGFCSFGKRREA